MAACGVAALACAHGTDAAAYMPGPGQPVVKFPASMPFTADEIVLRAQLFRPEGEGRFPAVVLMHGCGGWQPAVRYSLQKHAQFLVEHGFAVLSLDSFGPRHKSGGEVCGSLRQLRNARRYRMSDAFDALHYLQAQDFVDPDNIFLMGQSNGGSVAINVARRNEPKDHRTAAPGFRAVVAYYPWCGAFGGRRVKLEASLLVLGAEQDDWVPPDACQRVHAKGGALQVKVYPGAVHSFDVEIMRQTYLGKQVGYDKSAADDSRKEMLAFFRANLASSSQTASGIVRQASTD